MRLSKKSQGGSLADHLPTRLKDGKTRDTSQTTEDAILENGKALAFLVSPILL
jgi:hypothetical protein